MKKYSGNEFLQSRRNALKLVVGGSISASLVDSSMGVTDVSAAPLSICVRSPWAYYSFHSDNIGDNNEALDVGNESLPYLMPLSSDPGQWSENIDWWTGNGLDRAIEAQWSADAPGFDRVLMPDAAAYLVGIEIYKPIMPQSEEVIYRFGKTIPGVYRYGLELKINRAGKAQATMWDDAGLSVSIAGRFTVAATNGGHVCLFIFIDKREVGSQTMALYQYEAGSMIQSSGVIKDISFLTSVTGREVDSAKKVTVGARRNQKDILGQYFNGQLRGLNIINFGTTPPSNINDIMDGLSVSGMLPVQALDGV